MKKPTKLEKITGSLPANIASTLVAALAGNPFAALLPLFSSTLASERHKKRLEDTLVNISSDLASVQDELSDLDDAQYKLINEAVLALFQTIDSEKLAYLRNVINNTVDDCQIEDQEAAILARLVRDLSAAEATFVISYPSDQTFMLSETPPSDSAALHILPASEQGLIATGLVSLGLLVTAEPTFDGAGRLRFSPIVPKLVSLLEAI